MPTFVDTNILVYAEDRAAGIKHTIARANTGDLLLAAIRRASGLSVSFWEALILEAASLARCDCLWTEDLKHGQRIGDLIIVNPFLPESSPAG